MIHFFMLWILPVIAGVGAGCLMYFYQETRRDGR